jgi:hypothetical protein
LRLAKFRAAVKRTFEYPDDPDGAKVTIRLLSEGEKMEIADQATKYELEADGVSSRGKATMSASFYTERLLKMVACVDDWESVFSDDKGKKALACNEQNKRQVARHVKGFLNWVMEKYDELEEEHKKAQEIEEKNCESSPDGLSE